MRDEKQPKRLRFFFDYLDNADVEISNDALKEFAKADYADYKEMAKTLPAGQDRGLAARRKDRRRFATACTPRCWAIAARRNTPSCCATCSNDKEKLLGAGIDGIMAAYTMLKPKEGFAVHHGLTEGSEKALHDPL